LTKILLGVGGLVAWFVLRGVYSFLTTIPKEVAGPIILATGALLGAGVTYLLRNRELVEINLREARAPVYAEFMSFWFDKVFAASQPGGVPVEQEEVKQFINGFTQKVILLSSARFLALGQNSKVAIWGEGVPIQTSRRTLHSNSRRC
jgi:hypothetical protein